MFKKVCKTHWNEYLKGKAMLPMKEERASELKETK